MFDLICEIEDAEVTVSKYKQPPNVAVLLLHENWKFVFIEPRCTATAPEYALD